MCDLTTEWILESAQSLACALIRRTFYALERRTTHSSEWEGTQTLRRERQAHRWPSGWGEQCWLDQQGERPITELWGAEKLGRSEGSGMLIGDPLVEGSSASSTDGEPWRAENSFLGMRGTQLPMRSSRAENSLLRVRPIFLRMRRHSAAQKGAASPTMSSGERGTHSSEWEGTPRSAGSGMLIDNPLSEGSNASSTSKRDHRARRSGETHSSEWEGNSDAPQGAACSKMTL